MRIAFLGLGKMGSAVARVLLEKGYDVAVWNRREQAAAAVQDAGARVTRTPAECIQDASVVFTMLFGDEALRQVLLNDEALNAFSPDAVHVSLGTISVALAEELEGAHAARGQRFLGSPVFGRPDVAEQGKLWLAVAGDEPTVTELTPVLSTFSRGMSVVGSRPSQAHAVKLGGNFLITAMIASLAEGITFAEKHGIDAATYLETINSALFQSPFYASYSKVMLHPPDVVGATVKLGQKDTRLFQEAAAAVHVPAPLAEIFQEQFTRAMERGAGDEDWAAGYLGQTRLQAETKGSDE